MNENSAKIDALLENCEAAVRDVIAAAAQHGDYDTVGRGREVALRLCALRSDQNGIAQDQHRWHTSYFARAPSSSSKSPRGSRSPGYPRFELLDDNLFRYGWSKREKREYSHKVPRSVFDRVVAAMNKIRSTSKGPYSAEAIIERINDGADEPVPNYQVYAVLGFLKAGNAIEQRGREGYLIPGTFEAKAQECWNSGDVRHE
jgi:hypothetical protein